MSKLPRSFYLRGDVVTIARELIGQRIVSNIGDERTTGIITETEAYAGIDDRASHAYGGRRTARTGTMYLQGGTAYVYLCYGIHHLFNVVTHEADVPHAVLIRAMHPESGLEVMKARRGSTKLTTNGPGTVSQALGIRTTHSGIDLLDDLLYIERTGIRIPENDIRTGPRIGVDYAGPDAALPYRFHIDPRQLP
ncbi:MAG TPA: DNA-3-methyladenine glycosylase [Flavobacteriales bacterium]